MEPTAKLIVPPAAAAASTAARSATPKPAAPAGSPSHGGNATASAASAKAAPVPVPPKELDQRTPGTGPDRRNSVVDRRVGVERRQMSRDESGYTGPERRVAKSDRRDDTGLERRRGPGRRRSDDRKAAEEGEMTNEQFEFCMAIETYKKVNKKMYPTWTEVLEVMRQLGYRKVQPRDIRLENCPEPELYKLPAAANNANAA